MATTGLNKTATPAAAAQPTDEQYLIEFVEGLKASIASRQGRSTYFSTSCDVEFLGRSLGKEFFVRHRFPVDEQNVAACRALGEFLETSDAFVVGRRLGVRTHLLPKAAARLDEQLRNSLVR